MPRSSVHNLVSIRTPETVPLDVSYTSRETSRQSEVSGGNIMTALREWSASGSHDSAAGINRRQLLLLSAFGLVAGAPALGAPPKGELTWGVHVSLAPTWFDPAE